MLTSLHIKNLAIIDEVQLDFAQGFTVLTGETGAGKSILLDALGLVLGTRADPTLVRQGAEKAEISAEFLLQDCASAQAWLAANELVDEDEPSRCLIRRVVFAEGRTRAFVNGQAVNAAPLRELGESLVSIYGQNESQTLVRADVQRQLLDDYGGYPEQLSAVATAARAVNAADAAIAQALAQASRNPAEVDLLRHQVNELTSLQLAAGEPEALEAQHRRLANAGRLMADGARAGDLLSGAEGSADDVLSDALQVVASLADTDASFAEAQELLASAQVQLREAASQIQRQLDRLDLDPASLAELERRLSSLHDLARKHRVRLAELPEHGERLAQELADLEQAGSSLERLRSEREQTFARYRKAAEALSAARKKAAAKFATAITQETRQLGMANAQLLVQVEDAGLERVRSYGADEVRLDFSANPGQAPRALAKVASGGELSRISLAIQVALLSSASAAASAPTMVFDEVDAGIGGGVAEIVGQKLRALGQSRQVFCVTHLAPVAAQGQAHFGIGKRVLAGSTRTLVTPLADKARVQEVARMVGGVEITPATEGLAKDLLARAGQ